MSKTKKIGSRHTFKNTSKNSSDILTSRLNTNNSNSNSNSNDSKNFSIKFSTKKFFSHTQSIIKRGPKPKINKKDLFSLFISDNKNDLIKGKTIYNNKLDKYIFNESKEKCICENIFSKPETELPDDCECTNIKKNISIDKKGEKTHSIKCMKTQEILKTVGLTNYYIKMKTQTNKYMFIEMSSFALQTIINTYVYRELPNNTINIINSGVCVKSFSKKGYNLMEEADLGYGIQFLNKLLSNFYDDEFYINDEDKRYVVIVNFLLQVTFIIGHLQSSSLEFFHGNYKPENILVKRSDKKSLSHFNFNVFGKTIRVKNLGFVVLIADFHKASITIKDEDFSNKKYRIVSPKLFKPLLTELKLFKDFDMYTFFTKLVDNENIRKYIKEKKIENNIMSFMSKKFINTLYSIYVKQKKIKDSSFINIPIPIKILNKIKEPMNNVFSENYISRLESLNYKLFR